MSHFLWISWQINNLRSSDIEYIGSYISKLASLKGLTLYMDG